jgi:hypothetical protein
VSVLDIVWEEALRSEGREKPPFMINGQPVQSLATA